MLGFRKKIVPTYAVLPRVSTISRESKCSNMIARYTATSNAARLYRCNVHANLGPTAGAKSFEKTSALAGCNALSCDECCVESSAGTRIVARVAPPARSAPIQ
jgi:hypothetical protein